MKRFFSQTAVALACLTLLLLPLPTSAQTSDLGLSIGTSANAVNRGGGVAVFALVTQPVRLEQPSHFHLIHPVVLKHDWVKTL